MTRILSIDPGMITGIAICTEEGVEMTMTVGKEKLLANGFFNHLVLIAKPDVVLIEAIPDRIAEKTQLALVNHVLQWFQVAGFKSVVIKPAQWKGLAERVQIDGTHARDAATMARWYIEHERRTKQE